MTNFSLNALQKGSKVYFIGVGGVSMSGLAEILISKGYTVSGSDINHSPAIEKLEKMGLIFFKGHSGENVRGADLVVYTAAVSADNPEIKFAAENGIQMIPRSALLGAIMSDYKYSLAIAGTHGKTTVTSMLSYIFEGMKLDPTILVGASLDIINGNIKTGKSDYFIAEACEYHRSFLDFKPFCATILNVEPDHLDYYKDADDYHSAYVEFLELVSPNGFVVACADDTDLMEIIKGCPLDSITYGISNETADITARNISVTKGKTEYDLFKGNQLLCHVSLKVFGRHNILNSLAALSNAYMLGLDMQSASDALSDFKGAGRRFEYKGSYNGADVYDDYAHHPTEIKATLQAAREMPYKRIFCVFQPHTYSRMTAFFQGFAEAFHGVDMLVLTDIYAAREKDDGSISSKSLNDHIIANGIVSTYISDFDEIADTMRSNAKTGDIILVMGAGDIVRLTNKIIGADNK